MTGFVSASGVSGRWKQTERFLQPSRPALHLCRSPSRRTGSSPTRLTSSSHPQASCQAPTLTSLVSASLQASWVGYERCPEELDHSSVPASSKRVRLLQHRGGACNITVHRKKHRYTAKIIKCCHSGFQESKEMFLLTAEG